ncbi:hypothetical protein UFOVP147_39 [uncultured Caudovirales phage]|uniref:N-acetyltransferase domain-containing protein n=1 Tax=uncultured Caudovirales phage TaxID=2100421 RepID=A0A6J7W966_9CAUD|nr:hypothetical protein UFOVP147_39 [uncultured Caudovirales phage]
MQIVPFKVEHFWALDVQDAQASEKLYVKPAYLEALQYQYSFTILDGDEPMACLGCVELFPNRGAVWAYISRHAARKFKIVHRLAQRIIEDVPHKRLETEVDYTFREGHVWMRRLGFSIEAERMRCARPDGGDATLYVKVK